MTFTIELDDAALQARLAEVVARLERPGALMDLIGAKLQSNVRLRFNTKTDPNGQAWAPLRESTRKRYAKQDGERPQGTLLQRTGDMLASLDHNFGDSYVEVGFGDPVAAFHETGTARMTDRGMLTANPFTGELGAQDREDVLDVVSGYLAELL